jgi:hypothetical protein
MKTIKVDWVDESRYDASVTISDDVYSVVCFSSPFTFKENELFKGKLYAFNAEKIYRSYEEDPIIMKGEEFYEYIVRGRLEKETSTVHIGELLIDVSDAFIPKDILDGEMIEFKVDRLNLY